MRDQTEDIVVLSTAFLMTERCCLTRGDRLVLHVRISTRARAKAHNTRTIKSNRSKPFEVLVLR
jgi:hypothetical protein